MVTVFLTCYNHEKYIEQAVESCLHQNTRFEYEVIVEDDASSDRSQEILSGLASRYPERLKVVLNQENRKNVNAYHAISKSRGKYIACLDGDDFWCDDDRLQRDVDFLEEHPEYYAVCNGICVVDEEGSPIPQEEIAEQNIRFWEFSEDVFYREDFEQWKMPGQIGAMTFRNFFLEKEHDYSICYKAHSIVGDRTDVLISVLHNPIAVRKKIVSCYRFVRNSSAGNFMSMYRERGLIAEDYRMMCKFEQFAKEEFDTPIRLEQVKKDRYIAAVCTWMKHPSRETAKQVREIRKWSRQPIRYTCYWWKIVWTKTIQWKIRHTDARVDL